MKFDEVDDYDGVHAPDPDEDWWSRVGETPEFRGADGLTQEELELLREFNDEVEMDEDDLDVAEGLGFEGRVRRLA